MRILVLPKLHPGVSVEELQPHVTAEIQAVWQLYAQGICRELYARADRPGGTVLVVEAPTVEAAQEAIATLPLVERHLLDLDLIPLAPFTQLTRLFQAAS
jgi:hypothetical protein